MTALFTAALPFFLACAGAWILFRTFKRVTRRWAWVPLLAYLLAPLSFFLILAATSRWAVSLVSGGVSRTYLFDGSRGPVLWQVNSVLVWDIDDSELERRRLDIFDVDTGRRTSRHDYVHYWAVPIDVEVLGEGLDFVWLYSSQLGLHTRDLYDGRWLHGQQELLGDVQLATTTRKRLVWDSSTRGLQVITKEGRHLLLDARSLQLVDPAAAEQSPNRFKAYVDRERTVSGRRFELHNGSLVRLAEAKLAWEPVGTARFADGWFLRSSSLLAEYPNTFFILHQGNLSRVESDGSVRWTTAGVFDSSRLTADYAFIRQGRLCLVAEGGLICLLLDDGSTRWVIR